MCIQKVLINHSAVASVCPASAAVMQEMILRHPEYTHAQPARIAIGTWNVNGGKHFRSIAFKHDLITDWLLDLPRITEQTRPG